MIDPRSVIDFWFSKRVRPLWFAPDKSFDEEIRVRFGTAIHAAQMGAFENWRETQMGALALLLLLDQMPRNVYRGQAKAYLGEVRALTVADAALQRGHDRDLDFAERCFFYLPFGHAEEAAGQERAVQLFTRAYEEAAPVDRRAAEEQLDAAHRRRRITERFARDPHRNAALGRLSTEAEIEFLKTSGSPV
jgi:uncharacterized protein (DUF924 family)